jgi:hypothetical protein
VTEIEVQILILDSALDSARHHTARCKRRRDRVKCELAEAQHTLDESINAEATLERSIASMREAMLLRSVV